MGCHSYLIWSDWILCEDILHVSDFIYNTQQENFLLLICYSISITNICLNITSTDLVKFQVLHFFWNEIPGTTLMHDGFISFQTDSKQIWLDTKTWLQSQCMISNLIVGQEHFFTCVMMWSSKKYASLTISLTDLTGFVRATDVSLNTFAG